jgi:hypothetical protein
VTIRRGTVTIPFFPPAQIDISGTGGFTFQGLAVGWGFTAMTQCSEPGACPPGTTVQLEAEIAGSNVNGVARFRGTTYEDVGSIGMFPNLVLRLLGDVTLPAMDAGATTVEVPFELSGSFSFFADDGEPRSVTLTGGGTVTLFLEPAEGGTSWIVTGAEFRFRPARRVRSA